MDVLVVGGGQAALAAGYHLERLRRRTPATAPTFALLDRSEGPGGSWTETWDSLQLFSPAALSSLPGWPMPVWNGPGTPSAGHVRDYLAAYERRYDLPVHRPVRVHGVTRDPGDGTFRVRTDAQAWSARILVNATGLARRPFVPTCPGAAIFGGTQLHSAAYRRADAFEGRRVVVVGGGNSGAQIVADLSGRRSGSTTWVTRRPPRFMPDDVDGRVLFDLATHRIREGTAPSRPRPSSPGPSGDGLGDIVVVPPVRQARRRGLLEAVPMFHRLTRTGVAWDDPPRSLDVDVVIWCTGFRPDLAHLRGLPFARRDGLPVTDPASPTRSVDHPGLFFLGYGDWCGPASATLIGVGAAARATVGAAVDALQH